MSDTVPAVQEQRPPVAVGFGSSEGFALMQRQAQLLSASDLVPTEFRGNLPNCVIALEIANRIGANPLAVMQNLYIVHGKPGWSSQFIIGAINATGRYSPLRFSVTGAGDEKTCVAWATEIATGARLESPPVSIAMAKAEGWYGKKGSKWQTMEDLMLRYRSATFFGRLYAPEILMGMQTAEEVADVGTHEQRKSDVASRFTAPAEDAPPTTDAEIDEPAPEPPATIDTSEWPAPGEIVQTLNGEGTVVEVVNHPENGVLVTIDLGTSEETLPLADIVRSA